MSIARIEACFDCDQCGDRFTVKIDPAATVPNSWSMFEVAEDFIRRDGFATAMIDGDKHLCGKCGIPAPPPPP